MQKVLGNLNKGLFFIISAPSGTGKTTLINKLIEEFDCVEESVSYTTREPRENEIDGKDYNFISEEEFLKKIKEDEFLEYAKVYDSYYGTSKKFIQDKLGAKKHIILDIDTQGAMNLKGKIDATFIFIKPPSTEALKRRLKHRNEDNNEDVALRLSWAEKEIELAKNYDYNFINDDLNISYDIFRSIFIATEHKVKN